jgi:ABC-type antimicrobial peptide transport system permease subunit
MTLWTLIHRSLRFHARAHLGTWLGAVVGSAVLVGALVVGDSVRGSLRDLALARVGSVEMVLASGDRFFRAELADAVSDPLDTIVLPALQLAATATTTDNSTRANGVQLLGIRPRFWEFGRDAAFQPALATGEVALNTRLAEQLRARPGDTVVLRVARPSGLSRETPLSPQADATVALRLMVSTVVDDDRLGRFNLRATQIPPFNAFVPLEWLQQALQLPGRANLLLVSPAPSATPLFAQTYLRQRWQLDDAELELRDLPDRSVVELRTRRVFLDPPVVEAAWRVATNAQPLLTYFVNEIRAGNRSTPYSMVTAAGPPFAPAQLPDDEIVVNDWLAEDLALRPGDPLELSYWVIGAGRRLEEHTARFRVHSIVPLAGPAGDRELMPEFPGIERAESTRDWDASLPVSLAKIRPQDEAYWKAHRGTPKAFVSLAAGQRLWANRFGPLTAVRFPVTTDQAATHATIKKALRAQLDPAAVGLRFEPVRAQALAAAEQAQDFGGLFLGFSFFLIAAALLLMALLFQFGLEQRRQEIGTLLALGFTPKYVRRLLLFEGGLLALLGTLPGVLGGLAYARLMLHGLTTIWRDAVGATVLGFHAEPATLALGAAAATLVALITLQLALRRQARESTRELLADAVAEDVGLEQRAGRWVRRRYALGLILALASLGLLGSAMVQGESASPALFFGAGALGLLAGLALAAAVLGSLTQTSAAAQPSLVALGLRNTTRRRQRSLATLGLLACGSFLIVSIGVFRLESVGDTGNRAAGTGGFVLIGESTLPIVQDLNTPTGHEFFGLDEGDLTSAAVVAFRVREGDDASCLTLNRAQQPRLLGVRPEALAERRAFTFARLAGGKTTANPWLLLKDADTNEIAVPAIGDLNSILWAMGKRVGDTVTYTDERGRTFPIRLVGAVANSILQGNLIIDEAAFTRLFPSEDGYRMFLVDAPSNQVDRVSSALTRGLRDVGLELTPATRRLAQFNAVQNTYLGTFQVLGGLGLLLGSVGLGVVVMRNVLERRGELALLLAVGYPERAVRWLVLSEHAALLLAGLAVGLAAAGMAVLPSVLSPAAAVPYVSLAWTLTAVLASGAAWTWVAARWALRGELLAALRNE